MLSPKKVKYRKAQKGGKLIRGKAQRGSAVSFGEFGMLATTPGKLTARQIEAARVAINRAMKRMGRVWIRMFPDLPVTKKAAETRMGTGKGAPEFWVAVIQPGKMLYEVDGVPEAVAREAFKLAAAKLPLGTKVVARRDEL